MGGILEKEGQSTCPGHRIAKKMFLRMFKEFNIGRIVEGNEGEIIAFFAVMDDTKNRITDNRENRSHLLKKGETCFSQEMP